MTFYHCERTAQSKHDEAAIQETRAEDAPRRTLKNLFVILDCGSFMVAFSSHSISSQINMYV